jgi:glycosyltransferase involved in cell wall biosynthesis
MPSSPRILYAAGPGDVIGTYRHWKAGRDDPAQVAITYSSQFYDLCRDLNAAGYVISYHARKQRIAEDNLIIEHRPQRFARGPGPLYHLGQIWYGVRLAASALRFRADVAVVVDGTHWFALGLMRLVGVQAIPSLHCVLWLKHHPPAGLAGRVIHRLNARFFRRRAMAVLSISNDVSEQVRPMLNGRATPIIPFLPSYRRESFDGLASPPPSPPFRVFFAGRIERNKGVFDLLDIAKQFATDGHTDIEFDLCGDGSQLQFLRQAAIDAGIANRFRCHGHSTKPLMRQMYERCHVVIVPTTTDFTEGFNKVVAEGVLAGRPVITSSVCPALEYVKEAVVEVPPDDAMAYAQAILHLQQDGEFYQTKRQGCAAGAIFHDPARGWKAALAAAIQHTHS